MLVTSKDKVVEGDGDFGEKILKTMGLLKEKYQEFRSPVRCDKKVLRKSDCITLISLYSVFKISIKLVIKV